MNPPDAPAGSKSQRTQAMPPTLRASPTAPQEEIPGIRGDTTMKNVKMGKLTSESVKSRSCNLPDKKSLRFRPQHPSNQRRHQNQGIRQRSAEHNQWHQCHGCQPDEARHVATETLSFWGAFNSHPQRLMNGLLKNNGLPGN